MLKISAQDLNFILNNILDQTGIMLWVTDEAYQKDVYLSPLFQRIMGNFSSIMFQDFRKFYQKRLATINQENHYHAVEKRLCQRNEKKPIITYCIYDENRNKHYIKDVLLCNLTRKITREKMIMGYMQEISKEEYYKSLTQLQPLSEISLLDFDFNDLNEISTIQTNISKNSLTTHSATANEHLIEIHNDEIKISNRESECLKYLLLGLSTKLISRKLCISPRTVEIHINNLKKKANVMSRIELLAKLQNRSDFCEE